MKLLKRSLNNKMVNIGDDIKTGKWYYLKSEMYPLVDTLKIGEDVSFTSEMINGTAHLVTLLKGASSTVTETSKKEEAKVEVKETKQAVTGSSTQKTFEDNKKISSNLNVHIARQAIGHMVAETLQAMQGQINENNVLDLIPKLYETYKKQVLD